jgi:hypothetical protein
MTNLWWHPTLPNWEFVKSIFQAGFAGQRDLNKDPTRHEQDLIFDLSCAAKMPGMGFKKNQVIPFNLKKYCSHLLNKNSCSIPGTDWW